MSHQSRKLLIYVLFAMAILLMVGLQRSAYGNRNYREDEINTVHAAKIMSSSDITVWMASNIHPPAWRLLADSWIDTFGDDESVVRWSSVLANLLTFALLFRLGTDLFDWKVGIFAVIIIGLYPLVASYMNELRPYPYLIMLVTGLHWVFLRWIRHQSFRYMLAYIIFGILALYTHYYAIYVFPAHAIFLLLTVRWNRSFYLKTLSIWFFIAGAFAGWILPFIHSFVVKQSGGIYYALPNQIEGLELLYKRLRFQPEELGQLLLLLGLTTPFILKRLTRANLNQRGTQYGYVIYPAVLFITILILAWGANSVVRNVTARNMIILIPTVVLLMGLGLRALPKLAIFITIIILLLGAPQTLPSNVSNGPYREIIEAMSATYEADSVLVTEFSTARQWVMPSAYTLMDFDPINMAKQQMFHLINPDDKVHTPSPPDYLVNIHTSFDTRTLDNFSQNHEQLWLLQQGGGNSHRIALQAWLDNNYTQIRTVTWEDDPYPTSYTLTEYRRIPDNTELMLIAGDNLELHTWSLYDSVDVVPCQTISIESWWQTQTPIDTPYTRSIILADDNGQVAISEDVPANTFTIEWQPDVFYRDLAELAIPCNIETGQYNILLGMKDSILGTSLPLSYPDGNLIGELYYLTTLNVQEN